MQKLSILLFCVCLGCADIALRNDLRSSKNAYHWTELRVGMKRSEVARIMCRPDKKEFHNVEGKRVIVWYYLTSPDVTMDTPEYPITNYTPIIFIEGKLAGWGFDQYYHLLQIDPMREKPLSAKPKKETIYTNDQEEWPKEEHQLIPPTLKKNVQENEQKSLQPAPKSHIEKTLKNEVNQEKSPAPKNNIEKILKDELEKDKKPVEKSLPAYPKEDESHQRKEYLWE